MTYLFNILIGIIAGISSGFFGIGGAVVLVPMLVYFFKFPQHYAQGTALVALLLPVGVFAVIKYYQAGNVNIKLGLLISLGFFIGGFFGGHAAHFFPQFVFKRFFCAILFWVFLYILLGK